MNAYHEAVAAIYDACEFAAAPISLAAALEEMSARGERVALDPDLLIALFEVHLEAIACPATSSSAWTGDGLPPVGTVCEVFNPELHRSEWEKCTVLFVGKHRIVYDSESCSERFGYVDDLEFRPILTAEQIAQKQLDEALQDIEQLYDSGGPAAVYDAGYRKQEAV
ncbi:hypothetical protein PHLH8_20710 [Pseudomonas sp. Pc102]|uniref:hypothetical protein n=1 Tax=Pseudomonas sp. Pc102 TaxID=2678261 RepID=UPI001BCBA433|nr:hypothetical protein [Pseudomonas sp. Pc102]BBP82429.1 hypothetical protein PHLH8_20710 [Pseudomonas sp. Pc102]